MANHFKSVRSFFRNLGPVSLLEQTPYVLLGVTEHTAKALNEVGISTVFDLATSEIFSNAVDICLLAESKSGRFGALGKIPSGVLREGYNLQLSDIPLQPITILSSYSPKTKLGALATVIDIVTIQDLAAWPPYHSARELLSEVYNTSSSEQEMNSESPTDLVPANGQYPTERVHYEVLLFDGFVEPQIMVEPEEISTSEKEFSDYLFPNPLKSLLERVGHPDSLFQISSPIDISALISNNKGYQRPAVGGILTFTQSWFTKGLSLGTLIHSVALAPGESTKIAVIDWSRKARTSATENIKEDEILVSEIERKRSLNEM